MGLEEWISCFPVQQALKGQKTPADSASSLPTTETLVHIPLDQHSSDSTNFLELSRSFTLVFSPSSSRCPKTYQVHCAAPY